LTRKQHVDPAAMKEITFPDRYFAIWTYYKGHKQLVLRAPHFTSVSEPTFATRIDVLFKDVQSISCPLTCVGYQSRLRTRTSRIGA